MTDIAKLVAELTLDEKAALTAGADLWSTVSVPRLGIPSVLLTDGPNGARGTRSGPEGPTAACVPCGSALGATWDPDLVERVGALVGREARTMGARVLLAPTVNIHRSPLAGRNFECYSEDPLLAGRLAAGFVRGAQSQGVATTVKHFVGNDAEFERYTISSEIDERALREVYLRPFELAVREGGSLGIMTSYNRVNGRWCTEQPELVGVLRDDWGFEGFVVTDWFGITGTVASAEAGVDLEMPGPPRAFGPALAAAVRAGELAEGVVDAQVTRLLTAFDRIGALDVAGPDPGPGEQGADRPEDRALARRAATESMVLLANDGLLPLDRSALSTVAVIGPNADRAQIMGGGSASLRPHYLVTPLEALRAALGDGVRVVHERGCDNRRSTPTLGGRGTEAPSGGVGFDLEYFADADLGGELLERAVAAGAEADAVVLVVGTTGEWESEGHDRSSMDLPGAQDELVRRVLDANPATVVVVNAASPVTMDWAPDAHALLQTWFGGQEMAGGLAEVLLGDAEPAGRLPMTLPQRLEHNPSFGNFPGENGRVRYGEGVLVGYRWYEARHLPTRFPFGHGGSYTTFAVGELALSARSSTAASLAAGEPLVVTVPLTNTGDRRGAEVVQCYVAPIAPRLLRPPKELAGFAKVRLDPGEAATVRIELDDRAFAYWDGGQPDRDAIAARATALPMQRPSGPARTAGWQIDPGRYELHVGRSSAAIDHVLPVEITG